MKRWMIYVGLVVLFILHQDFWFWDDATLVFGVFPVGLFYHIMYSVVAGCMWALAIKFAWPDLGEDESQ
ncbi:MAG: DUF3311 domain-containing protein [Verrucomicrobiota bacterium]